MAHPFRFIPVSMTVDRDAGVTTGLSTDESVGSSGLNAVLALYWPALVRRRYTPSEVENLIIDSGKPAEEETEAA